MTEQPPLLRPDRPIAGPTSSNIVKLDRSMGHSLSPGSWRRGAQPAGADNEPGARRLAFLSHFLICLACLAVAFFAAVNGVPQTVFENDQSLMTSVIAVLFVGSSIYLGWQAWNVDATTDTGFGHLAERLAVMIGFVGTAMGLSLQAKALAGGSTSFEALATSLFTTVTGGIAAALLAIMTYSLEASVEREKRGADARRTPAP